MCFVTAASDLKSSRHNWEAADDSRQARISAGLGTARTESMHPTCRVHKTDKVFIDGDDIGAQLSVTIRLTKQDANMPLS